MTRRTGIDGCIQAVPPSTPKKMPLTAVPYAIWGNRGLGEMIVWVDADQ